MPKTRTGICNFCGVCQPCPAKIDIAVVHECLYSAQADGANLPAARARYRALPRYAVDCLPCGGCETRCPSDVPVIENMALAARLFA